SGIREIRGYGGFPISGQFLRTDDPKIVAQHSAKVYGKAAKGSPPMSVPHLDTRVVGGKSSLLFGPYAGFSTKYLKTGSYLDLFAALRWHNLFTFIGAGLTNLSLVWYLVTEVLSTGSKRHRALQQFAPRARRGDWHLITAGQRVQIMKRVKGKAVIQFGTEVVSSADGSIAGLLGASPGASTAVPIMLDVIAQCFPDRMAAWEPELERMIPSYGSQLAGNKAVAKSTMSRTAKALAISA
ncbi:MAG: malate:quinone oxidoreductase, partial [Pseudolysinimonas sp.]